MEDTKRDQVTKKSTVGMHDTEKDRNTLDETKAGVKGLVDSGVKNVPKMFVRPSEEMSNDFKISDEKLQIPVIDIANVDKMDGRKMIKEQIINALEKWGVFHVVNHGVPLELLENLLQGVKMFHEQNVEEKVKFYNHEFWTSVSYHTNNFLHESRFAVWRDTLTVKNIHPGGVNPLDLPPICRDALAEYSKKAEKFVELIYELISEALGLDPNYLLDKGCLESWALMCHYYPPCPEPQLTLGMNKHIDPSCVTLLVQDPNISGLQILHNNHWFDVDPLPGSFTIISGVLLQMLTNDKIKGLLWHRAKANVIGPRISVNMFFAGRITCVREFGPIKELVSADNPPKYRKFTSAEMIKLAYTEIPDKPVYSFFKIPDEDRVETCIVSRIHHQLGLWKMIKFFVTGMTWVTRFISYYRNV